MEASAPPTESSAAHLPPPAPVSGNAEAPAEPSSNLSPSLRSVMQGFAVDDDVSTMTIVASLLQLHPNYGGGKGEGLLHYSAAPDTKLRPAGEWLDDVLSLYNPTMVPELHGRLAILGLSLLDLSLAGQLAANGFLAAVRDEVREPFPSLLSPRGHTLYHPLEALLTSPRRQGSTTSQPPALDAVPMHRDQPLQTGSADELGRMAFAQALATRLRSIKEADLRSMTVNKNDRPDAFMLHIYGPWGAGKSTLLNFMRDELTSQARQEDLRSATGVGEQLRPQRWIVVEFNAWRHQRLAPPWWPLLDAVYKQAYAQLRECDRWRVARLWWQEHWWRFRMGWALHLLALGLGAIALYLALRFMPFPGVPTDSPAGGHAAPTDLFLAHAKDLSEMVTLALAVWGIGVAVGRSLLPGSARAADAFMRSSSDPMQAVANQYRRLVDAMGHHPLAIFIDDLDRCQGSYLTELLEGIQTLFREAPVTYVVAADRRWLRASYEKAYEAYAQAVTDGGQPLGYLFLEKIFQLSAPVPSMSLLMQSSYWKRLITFDRKAAAEELEKARSEDPAAQLLATPALGAADREQPAEERPIPGRKTARIPLLFAPASPERRRVTPSRLPGAPSPPARPAPHPRAVRVGRVIAIAA